MVYYKVMSTLQEGDHSNLIEGSTEPDNTDI